MTRGTRGTDTFDPIIQTTGAERMKRFGLSLAAAQNCTHRTVQGLTVTCENCPVMVRGRPAADFFACHLAVVTVTE